MGGCAQAAADNYIHVKRTRAVVFSSVTFAVPLFQNSRKVLYTSLFVLFIGGSFKRGV